MTLPHALLPFVLLLAACSSGDASKDAADDTAADSGDTDTAGDSGDTDTAGDSGDTDSDTDSGDTDSGGDSGDTGGDTGGDTLADIRDAMQRDAEGCQDVSGTPLRGAAVYFWGEYHGNETDGWTGEEAVYVFANDVWKAEGGVDCVGWWVTTATPGNTGSCSGCEVGMRATATYDVARSTCDERLYGVDFAENYALDLAKGGTSTRFFAGSGNTMGVGWWVDGAANFLSSRSCDWL